MSQQGFERPAFRSRVAGGDAPPAGWKAGGLRLSVFTVDGCVSLDTVRMQETHHLVELFQVKVGRARPRCRQRGSAS